MEANLPWLRARGRLFDVCSDVNDENLPAVGLRLSATCSTTSLSCDERHLYATELLTISEYNAVFGCLCMMKVYGDEDEQHVYLSDSEASYVVSATQRYKMPPNNSQSNTMDVDFFSKDLDIQSDDDCSEYLECECCYRQESPDDVPDVWRESDQRAKKLVLKKLLRSHVSSNTFRHICKCLQLGSKSFTPPPPPPISPRHSLHKTNNQPRQELYEVLSRRLRLTTSRLYSQPGNSLLKWRPRRTQMRLPPRPHSLIQDVNQMTDERNFRRGRERAATEDPSVRQTSSTPRSSPPPSRLLKRGVFEHFSARFLNLIGIYDLDSKVSSSFSKQQLIRNIPAKAAFKMVFVNSLTQLLSSCSINNLYKIEDVILDFSDFEVLKSIHRMSCFSSMLVESTQQQSKEVDLSDLIWIAPRARYSLELFNHHHQHHQPTSTDHRFLPPNMTANSPRASDYSGGGRSGNSPPSVSNRRRYDFRSRMCYPLSWYIEYSLLYFICSVSPELAPIATGRNTESPQDRWRTALKVFRGILAISNVLQSYYLMAKKQTERTLITVKVVCGDNNSSTIGAETAAQTTESMSDSFETHMELFKREQAESSHSNSTDDGISTSESFSGVDHDQISIEQREPPDLCPELETVETLPTDIITTARDSDEGVTSSSLPMLEFLARRSHLVITEDVFECIEEAAMILHNHFKAICHWPINPNVLLKQVEEFLDIPCIKSSQLESDWGDFVQNCIGPLLALGELDPDRADSKSYGTCANLQHPHHCCRHRFNSDCFARWRCSMYTSLSTNFNNALLHYYHNLMQSRHPQSISLRMAESCLRIVRSSGGGGEFDNYFDPPLIKTNGSLPRSRPKSDPTLLLPFVAADVLINLKHCARKLFRRNFGEGGHNLWMLERLRDCCHLVDIVATYEQSRMLLLPPKHACPWLHFRRIEAQRSGDIKQQTLLGSRNEKEDRRPLGRTATTHVKISSILADLLMTHISGDVFNTTFRLQWSAVPIPLTYYEAEILSSFSIAYDNVGGALRNVNISGMSPPAETALEEVCVSVICRWLEVILNEIRNLMSWNFLDNKILTEPSETPPLNNVTQWLHQRGSHR